MSYQQEKSIILNTARKSIAYGLDHHKPATADLHGIPEPLLQMGACFVTLEINHQLRGCIGSLEAHRPLIVDIVNNAYAAAFSDPRFPPLDKNEQEQLEIEVSILTPSEEMQFTDEQDLLRQIRPGVDGLIIEDAGRRGTFLPSVWESLPDKQDFLRHLKLKAGLAEDHWSDTIKVHRYTTEMIRE
jgi:AmmeMemoRadiSam system protein A